VVPEFGNAVSKYATLRGKRGPLASAKRMDSLDQFYDTVNGIPKWQEKDESTTVGDVVVTARSSTIKIANKEIILSQSEAAMFKLLVHHAGEPVSRERLCHPSSGTDFNYLTAHMYYFRKRLGRRFGKRIQTVPGRGYIYVAPDVSPLFPKQLPLGRTKEAG